jgi:hypothetical protein
MTSGLLVNRQESSPTGIIPERSHQHDPEAPGKSLVTKVTFSRSANRLKLEPSSQIEIGVESFDVRHPNAARESNQRNHEISKAAEASQDVSP